MAPSLQAWLNTPTDRGVSSPLYRRSWRDSPLGVHHGLPRRGASPPLATRGAWGRWALSTRWPRVSVLYQWYRGRYLGIPRNDRSRAVRPSPCYPHTRVADVSEHLSRELSNPLTSMSTKPGQVQSATLHIYGLMS